MVMRLAFTTYSSPDWTIEEVGEQARRMGYEGIEIRLLDGKPLPPDVDVETRGRIKRALHGLVIPSVGSGARFSSPDAAERAQHRADVERYMELANELEAPVVRVFGGEPADGNMVAAVERIADSLERLAPSAERRGVKLAIETHDAMSAGRTVADVLSRVPSRSVGAVWDNHHPIRMGEDTQETRELLRGRVLHAHVKDARRDPKARNGWALTLMGEGELPVLELMRALSDDGYTGWLSVEWENRQHGDTRAALQQHADVLRSCLRELGS